MEHHCPGPTTNALSTEGAKTRLLELMDMLVTSVAITGDANYSTGQAKIGLVVAGTDRNVETNVDNLNISEEAIRQPAMTIAGLKLTSDVTSIGTLETGAELS